MLGYWNDKGLGRLHFFDPLAYQRQAVLIDDGPA